LNVIDPDQMAGVWANFARVSIARTSSPSISCA
jgi:hypothetical protein